MANQKLSEEEVTRTTRTIKMKQMRIVGALGRM